MEWISVKDKLPECNDSRIEVIGFDGDFVYSIEYSKEYGFHYIDDGYEYLVTGITYWMPLPEPPNAD